MYIVFVSTVEGNWLEVEEVGENWGIFINT